MARIQKRRDEKALGGVQPNIGIEADYRRRLKKLIAEMSKSVAYWVKAAYRADPPEMAQDETPAAKLERAVSKLTKRWTGQFDDLADELATYFARSVAARTNAQLMSIFRKHGWTVKLQMTAAQRDVLQATIEQNVALIKSIPQQYFTSVNGAVMRSVQKGGDEGELVRSLTKIKGVSERRATFIARDQNRKATNMLARQRMVDLDLDDGIWVHSHAGKEPRPTHLRNDGKRFDLKKGWFDPDPKVKRRILPGELPGCRCFFRPVVKGFT